MNHDTKRVKIWRVGVDSSEKDLWSHVDRSSTGFISHLIILKSIAFGYPKISQSSIAILFKDNILRFKIFVYDIHWMDVLESDEDTGRYEL